MHNPEGVCVVAEAHGFPSLCLRWKPEGRVNGSRQMGWGFSKTAARRHPMSADTGGRDSKMVALPGSQSGRRRDYRPEIAQQPTIHSSSEEARAGRAPTKVRGQTKKAAEDTGNRDPLREKCKGNPSAVSLVTGARNSHPKAHSTAAGWVGDGRGRLSVIGAQCPGALW